MAEKTTRALGKFFEGEAKRFLEKKGMRCVDRNYVCRGGELDLVLRDGAYWVFAEVKARKTDAYGTPAEFVGRVKQKNLLYAAQKYMLENCIGDDEPCRFDVVEITYVPDEEGQPTRVKVTHIEDAFWRR